MHCEFVAQSALWAMFARMVFSIELRSIVSGATMMKQYFGAMILCLSVCVASNAADIVISEAVATPEGFLQHTVESPYQSEQTDLRVLLPDDIPPGARLPVVYVLPVEARGRTKFGDGLVEIKRLGLHNSHRAAYVSPSFSQWPWYGDHPTDPGVRQETYFLSVVLPFVDKIYPVSTKPEDRLLLGFSKSGWGAWSLLLRHPNLFGRAAAWDSPMMMERCDRFGTPDVFAVQETFEKYRIPDAVRTKGKGLGPETRLILTGYEEFRTHHQQLHDLLISLDIPHEYRDGPFRKHDWHSGWVRESLDLLFAGRELTPPTDRSNNSAAVPEYEWVQVAAKAAFAPRDGAGALVFRGRMWLLGGWNPGDKLHFPRICNNEVWSSADGTGWRLDKPNTFLDRTFDPLSDWEGRHTAGYAVLRDKLWIIGGDTNQGHYQNDVWNSPDGKTWSLVSQGEELPWAPRALHYVVSFRDKLWVMGGQTMPAFAKADEKFYRDVWTSTDGKSWKEVVPEEPWWTPRGMIGGSAVFEDRIWILGGGTYDTPTTPKRNYDNDVWSSSDGVHWTQHVAQAPWEPRQYHDVAIFDGRLWVLEGYSGRNRNDVWHSADGVHWHEVPGTPWAPRHAASVFSHAGALWMVAGNNMQSDVWKLRRKQ